jgi:hypothetical protein
MKKILHHQEKQPNPPIGKDVVNDQKAMRKSKKKFSISSFYTDTKI